MSADHDKDDGEVPDEGLQSERTYLAWQRTGLAFAALGALLVHSANGQRHPLAEAPGLFGLTISAAILSWTILRYHGSGTAPKSNHDTAVPRMAAAVSAATVVLCLSGLALVLVGL